MRFASPYTFLLLFLLPLIAWAAIRRRRTGSILFSSLDRVRQVKTTWRTRMRHLLLVLRLACFTLLIVAMARPQTTTAEVRISTQGIAIEMVVDRSSSMRAEMEFAGERLNRLEVVKKVFVEFVSGNDKKLSGRPNDMIGMIAFARYADTICPLVRAHDALVEFAKSTQIVKIRSEDGTAIGDAIALAAARLKRAEKDIQARQGDPGETDFTIKSKVIILLTDGRSNVGDVAPLQAAELAKEWGIKIYTIGIGGGESFTTVRTPFGSMKVPSNSDMDAGTLQEIAEVSDGKFFQAEDAEALREIYEEIDRLEKTEVTSLEFAQYNEAFTPYGIGAALVLLLEILLASTWLRRAP